MGGCASRPKDLDNEAAPAPVEVPAVVEEAPAVAEATQEKVEEVETKKEEPLVDLSEPAPVAQETKEEIVGSETKVVDEVNVEKKEVVA